MTPPDIEPRDARPIIATRDERSGPEVVTDLWQNVERLLGQELNLLRRDVEQRVAQTRNDVLELSVAGSVAYAGALALTAAIVLLLSKRLEPWLSALLVGLLALAAGYGMVHHATRKLAKRDLVPRTTVESLEKTTHTIKEALR
jgi:predicted membrane-bound spermidine synthase